MIEKTFVMIKSGAVSRNKHFEILAWASSNGLRTIELRMEHLTQEKAKAFYAEHEGRPYFERLIKSVTTHPIVAGTFEGENAISLWRALLGQTDPEKAPKDTIRGIFGTEMPDNAAHGSDSQNSAKREIGFFFPDLQG